MFDGEFWVLLNAAMRSFLLSVAVNWGCYVLIVEMLEKKKEKTFWLFWVFVGKSLVNFVFLQNIASYYWGDQLWWKLIYPNYQLASSLLVCFLYTWNFKGGYLKVVMAMTLAECLMEVTMTPSLLVVNFLEKRESLFSFFGKFEPMDLLLPLFVLIIFGVLYPLVRPFLRRFRSYTIRHRKFWWTAYVVFLAFSQKHIWINFIGDKDSRIPDVYIFSLIYTGLVVTGTAIFCKRYRDKIKKEHLFLSTQQSRMDAHYTAIQEQIRKMEESQKFIDSGMEHMEERVGVSDYLNQLRKQYEELRAGMYCDDYMLDSLLYCQAEEAKKQGIAFDSSLQGYDRGSVEEEDLVKLVCFLLEWGFTENRADSEQLEKRELHLRMFTVKSQLFIKFSYTSVDKKGMAKSYFKEWIQKYSGTVEIRRQTGITEVEMTLYCGGEGVLAGAVQG